MNRTNITVLFVVQIKLFVVKRQIFVQNGVKQKSDEVKHVFRKCYIDVVIDNFICFDFIRKINNFILK